MKWLVLLGFVAFTYGLPSLGKNVNIEKDGTINITDFSGKNILISKQPGQQVIEIRIGGQKMPLKVVRVNEINHVNVEGQDKEQLAKIVDLIREYQGPITEETYQKLLQKIQVAVQSGEVNPLIHSILEKMDIDDVDRSSAQREAEQSPVIKKWYDLWLEGKLQQYRLELEALERENEVLRKQVFLQEGSSRVPVQGQRWVDSGLYTQPRSQLYWTRQPVSSPVGNTWLNQYPVANQQWSAVQPSSGINWAPESVYGQNQFPKWDQFKQTEQPTTVNWNQRLAVLEKENAALRQFIQQGVNKQEVESVDQPSIWGQKSNGLWNQENLGQVYHGIGQVAQGGLTKKNQIFSQENQVKPVDQAWSKIVPQSSVFWPVRSIESENQALPETVQQRVNYPLRQMNWEGQQTLNPVERSLVSENQGDERVYYPVGIQRQTGRFGGVDQFPLF